MFVLFLYGLPATGKYTIGKIVAERLAIPFFHNHLTVDLVSSLFAYGTPEFIAMREQIWIESFRKAAETDKSFVFTFNPESTVEQTTIDALEFAVKGNRGELIYIELACAIGEIENRISNKSRAEFGKLTDISLFNSLFKSGTFASPVLPPPALKIDTEKLSADECAEAILRYLADRDTR